MNITPYVNELVRTLNNLWPLMAFLCKLAPAVILSYWTYREFRVKASKDAYEAAWLAIGWCTLAFILKA